MEVEIHVSEEELAEFPEEATDSTAGQSQSGKTSQTPNQGTVQSLLLVRATPTPSLLRRIRKGCTRYMIRESPKSSGGSGLSSQYKQPYSVVQATSVACHPPLVKYGTSDQDACIEHLHRVQC